MKPSNSIRTLLVCALAFAAPAAAMAQTALNDPLGFRRAGEREFTIGGAGAADRNLRNSYGGANFSYGWYASENALWVIRQSLNYSDQRRQRSQWNGSTRVAYDHHFGAATAWRPFVGANFGGVYGDNVRDTFAAGLEGGVKFYVQPRTFVYGMAEYGWFFRRARALDNQFRSGQFNWGIGLGYNF
jgi:hypothetical protein